VFLYCIDTEMPTMKNENVRDSPWVVLHLPGARRPWVFDGRCRWLKLVHPLVRLTGTSKVFCSTVKKAQRLFSFFMLKQMVVLLFLKVTFPRFPARRMWKPSSQVILDAKSGDILTPLWFFFGGGGWKKDTEGPLNPLLLDLTIILDNENCSSGIDRYLIHKCMHRAL
jgi:hypothetical protein